MKLKTLLTAKYKGITFNLMTVLGVFFHIFDFCIARYLQYFSALTNMCSKESGWTDMTTEQLGK